MASAPSDPEECAASRLRPRRSLRETKSACSSRDRKKMSRSAKSANSLSVVQARWSAISTIRRRTRRPSPRMVFFAPAIFCADSRSTDTVDYAFEGRIKDNINRGGEKIGAEELENLIAGHPDVLDSRVVAMPDKIYGEKVCAYVVPRPGHAAPRREVARRVSAQGGDRQIQAAGTNRKHCRVSGHSRRQGRQGRDARRHRQEARRRGSMRARTRRGSGARHEQSRSRSRWSAAGRRACCSQSWLRATIRIIGSTCSSRIPSSATYGFGIVLADVALDFLNTVDPDLHADLVATAERQDTITLYHRGTAVPIRGNVFLGIPRVRLLNIMQAHAAGEGVNIVYSKRIDTLDALSGYDLIVGADGVNSAVRNALQHEFPGQRRTALNKWAWYGTRHRFNSVELIFEQTPLRHFHRPQLPLRARSRHLRHRMPPRYLEARRPRHQKRR